MRRVPLSVAATTLLVFVAGRAPAAAQPSPITFEVDKERTRPQRLTVAALGAGAVVVGGLGGVFHLQSQRRSDAITASGAHSGLTYDAEVAARRGDALTSRRLTIAAYGVAGGLLVATVVAFVLTDPGTEVITLDEGSAPAALIVAPLGGGGAVLGGAWSF